MSAKTSRLWLALRPGGSALAGMHGARFAPPAVRL